ncbi:hypothetical protein PM082_008766 [Marasmius tenuissimus]|nr:hypothetical protein PM082_008766 [Marasmius tenuissimus]
MRNGGNGDEDESEDEDVEAENAESSGEKEKSPGSDANGDDDDEKEEVGPQSTPQASSEQGPPPTQLETTKLQQVNANASPQSYTEFLIAPSQDQPTFLRWGEPKVKVVV